MTSNLDELPDGIPVTVLTGFLGSGKTTLLAHLLRDPALKDTAVIINEFGEIGLDHHLIEQVKGEVVVMESGCVCCTIRSDLGNTLRSLYLRRARGEVPAFKRVVIETTGLADPAPIVQLLIEDPLVEAYYRLDGIIATVDAVNGKWQLFTEPHAVKQVAVADRVVLTKTDLASREAVIEIAGQIQALNPGAPLVLALHGQVASAALFNVGLYDPTTKSVDVQRWLRDEAYAAQNARDDAHDHGHAHDPVPDHGGRAVGRHDARIASTCLTATDPLDWDGFSSWLDRLLAERGADILRVKGILNVTGEDRPVVIHGVQHLFHPPARLASWPDDDRRSRLVFITRDLDRATLERGFAAHREPTGLPAAPA